MFTFVNHSKFHTRPLCLGLRTIEQFGLIAEWIRVILSGFVTSSPLCLWEHFDHGFNHGGAWIQPITQLNPPFVSVVCSLLSVSIESIGPAFSLWVILVALFDKQSFQVIMCHLIWRSYLSKRESNKIFLLPKLRKHIAEFLKWSYLNHLSILMLDYLSRFRVRFLIREFF